MNQKHTMGKPRVGVFFGTFNPIHRRHLEICLEMMRERGLSQVYLHCTVVPRSDREALAAGEIRVADRREGRIVYETTEKADPARNYFRTGNEFYSYATRVALVNLAIRETGNAGRLLVLDEPAVYTAEGFAGIIDLVRELHPKAELHGVHGSDVGGMLVRGIYDQAGVEPFQIERQDEVSATKIRAGVVGMTTPGVDRAIGCLRQGVSGFIAEGEFYRVEGLDVLKISSLPKQA